METLNRKALDLIAKLERERFIRVFNAIELSLIAQIETELKNESQKRHSYQC